MSKDYLVAAYRVALRTSTTEFISGARTEDAAIRVAQDLRRVINLLPAEVASDYSIAIEELPVGGWSPWKLVSHV